MGTVTLRAPSPAHPGCGSKAIQKAAIVRPVGMGWPGSRRVHSGGAGPLRTLSAPPLPARSLVSLVWSEEEGTGLGKPDKVLE